MNDTICKMCKIEIKHFTTIENNKRQVGIEINAMNCIQNEAPVLYEAIKAVKQGPLPRQWTVCQSKGNHGKYFSAATA